MINKELFRWFYKENDFSDIYPPVVWNNYQLNYFDSDNLEFIRRDDWNVTDAIKFSVNFYNVKEYSLTHLSKIYKICLHFNIDPEELKIFSDNGIKGRIAFENLENFLKMDATIIHFFEEKKLPLKYVRQIMNLKDNHRSILVDYIEKKTPSTGDFRNFLNFLTDYHHLITEQHYVDDLLERVIKIKDKDLLDFKNSFFDIIKGFKSIKIKSITNFETSELEISFIAKDLDEIKIAIEELKDFERFESIFKLMEKYDIS